MPTYTFITRLKSYLPRPKTLRGNNPERSPQNILEVLSDHRVPDGGILILLTFLMGLTLVPYFGGRTLWLISTTAAQIPTMSEDQFWLSVVLCPGLWVFTLGRTFDVGARELLRLARTACILGASLAGAHSIFPAIGLTAVTPLYVQEFALIHDYTVWRIIHRSGDRIAHDKIRIFRTPPVTLQVEPGCALRINTIRFASTGYAASKHQIGGFDLHVFAGTGKPLPVIRKTLDPTDDEILREPEDMQVRGAAVVKVLRSELASKQGTEFLFTYDFTKRQAQVLPYEFSEKTLSSTDIAVGNSPGQLPAVVQFTAWTKYRETCKFHLHDPVVRIEGSKHCGVTRWLVTLLREFT